jgi:hypothetical protein
MSDASEQRVWAERELRRERDALAARLAEAERDAARYRWLRDKAGNKVMRDLMDECRPDGWDRIVDKFSTTDSAEAPLTTQERQNLDDACASMEREPWSVGAPSTVTGDRDGA